MSSAVGYCQVHRCAARIRSAVTACAGRPPPLMHRSKSGGARLGQDLPAQSDHGVRNRTRSIRDASHTFCMAKHLHGKKAAKRGRWGKRSKLLGHRHRKRGKRLKLL
jgi:hypothetical protein